MKENITKVRWRNNLFLPFGVCLMIYLCRMVQAQTAILEYKFDETGTTAPSTGSNVTAVTLRNSAGAATDLHSADSLGVSGLTGDRAFDNTASSSMGGSGGRADQADLVAIDTLTSFTLQGWFKTDGSTAIGGGSGSSQAVLLHNTSGSGGSAAGFQLFGQQGDSKLAVDNGNASTSEYGDTQSWIFFAVTYDGSSTSDNVKFYKGSASSEVTLVATQTINKGQVNSDTSGLGIGNESGGNGSPFDGYLDNVRVYGSQGDNSGVLTLTQLESIRAGDVPPTVSSTSPANGATGVAVNTTITATFSEAMDASTITTSTFTVSTGGGNISGTVSYNSTTKTATFTPSGNLSFPTTYTATITTGIKDTAGTAMVSNYSWSFTTESVTEFPSPTMTGFDRDNYLPSLNDQNDYDRACITVVDSSANTTGSWDTITVTIKAGSNSIAFKLIETTETAGVFSTCGNVNRILYPVGTSSGYVEDFNSGSHNYPALGTSVVGLNLKQLIANTEGDAHLGINGELIVTAGDTIGLIYGGTTLDSASIGFNSGSFYFSPGVVSPVTTSSLSAPNLVISITDPDENLNPVAKDVIGFADNSALLARSPGTGTSRVQIEAIDQITGSTLSISGTDIVARHIMLVETGNNTGVFAASGKVFGSNTVTSSSLKGNLLISSQTPPAYAGQDITLGKPIANSVGCTFRIIEANASGRIGLYEAKGTTIAGGGGAPQVVGLLPVLGFTTGSDFINKGTSTLGIGGVTSGITTTRVVAIGKTTSAFGSQTDNAVNQGTSTSGLIKLIEGDKYCLVAISEFVATSASVEVGTFSTYENITGGEGGSVTVTIDAFQLAGPRSGDTLKVSYLDELDSGGVSGTVTGALSYGVAGVTGTLERDNAAPDINDLVTLTVVDGNLNTNTSAQESVAAGSRLWGGTTTSNRGGPFTVEAYSTSSKKISLSHPDGSAVGTQTIRIAKTDNSLVWMVPASLASASSDRFQNPLSAGSATFSLGTESVSTIPLVKGSSSDADSFLRSLASTSSFVATLDGLDNTVEISPDGTHWISIPIVETGANSSTFVGTIGFDCTAARITTSTTVTASTTFSDFTGTSSITFSSEGGNTTLTSIIGTGSVVRISDGTFAEVKEVTGVSGSVLSVEKLRNSSFYTPWKTWVQVVGNDLDNNRLDTTLAGSSVFRIGGFYGATYRIRYNDAADANNAYLGGDTLAATTPSVAFQTNTGVLSVSPSGTVGLNSQIEVVLVDDDLNVSTATANTTFINQTTTFLNLNEAGLGNPQGTSSTNTIFKNGGIAKQILVSRATSVTSASFAEASNTVTVTLTETGANSGTFKGTYKLSSGSSTTGAESPPILKVSSGDTITVFYNDSPSATSENNLSAYTTVPMLVQGGLGALSLSKSEAFLSGDSVVITLSDMDKNTPNSLDSATVSYKSSSDTLSSSMSLTETAANSGMFKGTLRTSTTSSSSTTPPTVRAVVNGAVTITYTDDSPAADITALFSTKNFGAVLDITSASVAIDGNAIVSLSDKETNTSISTANVASLNIKSITDSTGVDVIVTETGADTGSFLGTIKVSTSSSLSNTNIKAAVGDTLTVTFTDRPDATGLLSVVTDTAMVTVAVTPTPTPIPGASPTPTATPTPTGVVAITGTVVSSPPGAPISSAMVSTDTGGFTATTGADGTYTISNVTPGAYTLTASATGFVSSSQSVTVTAGVTTTVHFDLVPVTVTPTATATPTPTPCEPEDISVSPPKSLTLKRNASGDITVTVTGEDDCAVAGEPVTATTNTAGEKRISISPASDTTDANGEIVFTITAKNKTGNARVTFKAEGVKKSLRYTVKVKKK